MYAWYEKAEVCYAVLDGVPGPDAENFEAEFKASRWLTRGWILQELLAPENVVFFGRPLAGSWIMLGDRDSLCLLISTCTRIPTMYLMHHEFSKNATIAGKMSWVAKRETTREEDIAYCLLGLFSVSMPLLYGDGPRAFMRLQEEIMKISDDQTIFAWMHDPSGHASECGFEQPISHERFRNSGLLSRTDIGLGLLADRPEAFLESGKANIFSIPMRDQMPYHMTNRGLSISLKIKPIRDPVEILYLADTVEDLHLADTRCYLSLPPNAEGHIDGLVSICVYLKRISTAGVHQFVCIRCEKLAFITKRQEDAKLRSIFIRTE